ncbi:MAG: IPT/TIG domain-containing protein [Prevotellaceae bacterium]|nr:IPT/TIG domain-containing protein [Prevotellaceae bacterium]
MKKIQKYLLFIVLLGGAATFTAGCSEEKEFSADYDIPWQVSRITNVTPIEAAPGANITLTGENLGTDLVLPESGFLVGTQTCTVVSQTATSVVITVPASVTEPVDVSVRNLHNRTFVYEAKFRPAL